MRKPIVGFTTAVNSIFVFIIIAAYVFGGHEIDVDVDSKGKMVCADMR